MPTKIIIGVMGPGESASKEVCLLAYELGKLIAQQGWVTLSGGRNQGVMDAVSRGAKEAGGLTLGILPGSDYQQVSKYIDIPVLTGLGNARNNINILTAQVVVCCGMGLGTLSETALAIKQNRHVIFLAQSEITLNFFHELVPKGTWKIADTASEVIKKINLLLSDN